MGRSIAWISLVLIAGCSRVDLPERVEVRGTVTLDGNPVPQGEITFMPDAPQGTTGPSATGAIDANGNYALTTYHQGGGSDGAIPGFHRVRIVAREITEPGAASKSLIPNHYSDFRTSGLTAEVKADEKNTIDWNLTSR